MSVIPVQCRTLCVLLTVVLLTTIVASATGSGGQDSFVRLKPRPFNPIGEVSGRTPFPDGAVPAAGFIGDENSVANAQGGPAGTLGYPTTVVNEVWDPGYDDWQYQSKAEYTYDGSGKLNQDLSYSMIVPPYWTPQHKTTYSYDETGHLTFEMVHQWQMYGVVWVNSRAVTYTNDANGQPVEILNSGWNGSGWDTVFRQTATYGDDGWPLEAVYQYRESDAWMNYWKYSHTYDSLMRATSYAVQEWNGVEWVNTERRLMTYGSGGSPISVWAQSWLDSVWFTHTRHSNTYDDWGRLITETVEIETGHAWTNKARITRSWDVAGRPVQELTERWSGSAWVNDSVKTHTYDPGGNLLQFEVKLWAGGWDGWVNDRRTTYTYGPLTGVGDEENIPGEYRLEANYPNPFNPSTTIRFSLPERSMVRLTIYDVMGRLVESLAEREIPAGVHEIRWDAAGLPSGVYYCRMQAEGFVQTRKLVLMR